MRNKRAIGSGDEIAKSVIGYLKMPFVGITDGSEVFIEFYSPGIPVEHHKIDPFTTA